MQRVETQLNWRGCPIKFQFALWIRTVNSEGHHVVSWPALKRTRWPCKIGFNKCRRGWNSLSSKYTAVAFWAGGESSQASPCNASYDSTEEAEKPKAYWFQTHNEQEKVCPRFKWFNDKSDLCDSDSIKCVTFFFFLVRKDLTLLSFSQCMPYPVREKKPCFLQYKEAIFAFILGLVHATLLSSNTTSWIIARKFYFCFIVHSKRDLISQCGFKHGSLGLFFFLSRQICMKYSNGDDCGVVYCLEFSV